jgi:hypothetical protein
MNGTLTFRRFAAVVAVWTIAAILGLTVALVAVGALGLWVAIGAIAGLGTTIVGGWFGQLLFVTDFDALLAEKVAARARAQKRGDMS